MTVEEIRSSLKTADYDFLRTDLSLGENIIFLTLGGSYAYGTNNDNSDIDIRGCAMDPVENILLGRTFEQVVDMVTDTTIYSFSKLVTLLTSVNPNTIELLGNKPEHYFYISKFGQQLINNAHLFLSRKAIYSFGGYANAQLRRLENIVFRSSSQSDKEKHIFNSIKYAEETFLYQPFAEDDFLKLYIDKAVDPEMDTEIFMDVKLTHYPMRDYLGRWAEYNSIARSYNSIGKHNKRAIENQKIGKHMMHLIRLYLMCFDILEKEKIITYRENDLDLLLAIRHGKYQDEEDKPIPEFYELMNELQKRLDYASEHTNLPVEPDIKHIEEFKLDIISDVVRKKLIG